MADFLNAARPEEIIFGNNMTSLTLHISRSLVQTLDPGDEIVLTHLDHDANVSPWLLAARDRGCRVTWIDFDVEDCTLKMNEFERVLERRPKLVAFGYASNAVGTINLVGKITRMAHAAGALVYVDAVQFAPHGPIDVQALGVDFLVCSAYKFFGPHAGALYGRYELLDELKAYKVRPAPDSPPGKFETGTQNHEGIAGVLGALEYFEWLGKTFGGAQEESLRGSGYTGRKLELKKAMSALRAYEFELSRALLSALDQIPGLRLYGLADPGKVDQRVPTFSFTLEGKHPRSVAEALAKENIYVWDGNYYALEVTTRLGLEASGGMVRVGAVHYNTLDEVARLGEVLKKIARAGSN
jgi:cysteine desulfurase family protein (TIGR01976 family)